ncbi:hypothetical protein NDU88_001894 [Pleurodeles waltl]|uniref:Uncharacterized protein n=1 Tax=Pleurodeles waltl TaxID=8319 RepID=A0AAV7MLM9_PLEWA|nr:hypothetical protein NDU88_001894 [Pleurodeles waltl]
MTCTTVCDPQPPRDKVLAVSDRHAGRCVSRSPSPGCAEGAQKCAKKNTRKDGACGTPGIAAVPELRDPVCPDLRPKVGEAPPARLSRSRALPARGRGLSAASCARDIRRGADGTECPEEALPGASASPSSAGAGERLLRDVGGRWSPGSLAAGCGVLSPERVLPLRCGRVSAGAWGIAGEAGALLPGRMPAALQVRARQQVGAPIPGLRLPPGSGASLPLPRASAGAPRPRDGHVWRVLGLSICHCVVDKLPRWLYSCPVHGGRRRGQEPRRLEG